MPTVNHIRPDRDRCNSQQRKNPLTRFSVIFAILFLTAACEPARRTAELPVISKPEITQTEISDQVIQFVIKRPERPMMVGMRFGVSSCEVTLDHREFLPARVIEGLKGFYPKSTFTMKAPGQMAEGTAARVSLNFLAPAQTGYCNSIRCAMTTHLNAQTTITPRGGQSIQKDVFVTSNKENIDGFGLGGWCRTLPELSTATMGEIITSIPRMVRGVVEAELGN